MLCRHCQLTTPAGAEFCCLGCELAFGIEQDASRDMAASAGRVTFAALLAMVVMMLSLFLYAQDVYGAGEADGFGWMRQGYRVLLLLLTTPVVLMLGWPLARSAFRRLRAGGITLELLIFVAASAAFVLSCVSTLRGYGAVYFDSAAAALLLATVGRYLEARVRTRAAAALAPLASLGSTKVWAGPDEDSLSLRDPASIESGEVVRIEPRYACPVDVEALAAAQLDLSAINGEPRPRQVVAGECVAAGAVPIEQPLLGRASSTLQTSTLRRTEELTRALAGKRGQLARLADRLARWLAPLVGALALGALLYWWQQASLGVGLSHALAVLLVACPCTYGVVAPLVLWMALERAAARGIAVRDAATIEQLAELRHIAFDKTGTLTDPLVATLAWHAPQAHEAELWRAVEQLERGSRHPVAQSLLAAAAAFVERNEAEQAAVSAEQAWEVARGSEALSSSRTHIGAGVAGYDERGRYWRLGSARWMDEARVSLAAEAALDEGLLCAHLAIDGRHVASFSIVERLRPAAPRTVAQLARLGVGASICSGDPSSAPMRIAQRLGVAGQGGLSAADKAGALARLPRPLAAVGDGSNDAPLMAGADVSVAVSRAVPLARDMADVVLLDADLDVLPWLLSQSRRAKRVVRRALFAATAYNLVFLCMAAAGLLLPVWAGLSMLLSSLLTLAAVVASLSGEAESFGEEATALSEEADIGRDEVEPTHKPARYVAGNV